MDKRYRVAVIGSTGKGGYGHGLDKAFNGLDGVNLVALADENPEGLAKAGKRLAGCKLYLDFRMMLLEERPDVVAIAPGWVTERVSMVEAAAEVGSHIYCEKPVAGSLAEVDVIMAACQRAKVKMAVAHQWRAMRPIQKILRDVREGKFGNLLRIGTRPKDDSRGGGEELILHGTHLFDLMIAFCGDPRWVSAHITVEGVGVTAADVRQGTQPVGLIAGDSISASFGFDGGVRGFFESTANLAGCRGSTFDNLYGVSIECERATLELREPGDAYIYPAPRVLPDLEALKWQKVSLPEWHGQYDTDDFRRNWLHIGNQILVKDLISAIEEDREPLSSIQSVRFVNEMVQGAYLSHLSGGERLCIPLSDRVHPLE